MITLGREQVLRVSNHDMISPASTEMCSATFAWSRRGLRMRPYKHMGDYTDVSVVAEYQHTSAVHTNVRTDCSPLL